MRPGRQHGGRDRRRLRHHLSWTKHDSVIKKTSKNTRAYSIRATLVPSQTIPSATAHARRTWSHTPPSVSFEDQQHCSRLNQNASRHTPSFRSDIQLEPMSMKQAITPVIRPTASTQNQPDPESQYIRRRPRQRRCQRETTNHHVTQQQNRGAEYHR